MTAIEPRRATEDADGGGHRWNTDETQIGHRDEERGVRGEGIRGGVGWLGFSFSERKKVRVTIFGRECRRTQHFGEGIDTRWLHGAIGPLSVVSCWSQAVASGQRLY